MSSPELEGKLVEILTSIQQSTGAALEQLPELAQSYVLYGRIKYAVMIVLALAALAGVAGLVRFGISERKRAEDDRDHGFCSDGFCYFFPAFLIGFVALIMLITATSNGLLIWFAPKVWLLQEFTRMVR